MSQPDPPRPDQPWQPPTDSGAPSFPGFTPAPRPGGYGQSAHTTAGGEPEPPTQPFPPSVYPAPPYRAPTYPGYPVPPEQPTQPGQAYPPPAYPPPVYPQPGYPQPGYPQQSYPPPAYPQQSYGQPGYAGGSGFPGRPGDPWVGDGGHAYGPTEVLGPPAAPRRRRRRVAIAVGVVLALVVSGAAVAGAALWYGWGATEPEDVLPGSSAVFARIDLSPGLGQQLALAKLAKKFPQQQGGEDILNSAKQNLVKNVLDPLDFDTDIKPWLGDRLGAAMWAPAGAKTMCYLLALASTDDGKAGAALARVPHVTYAFSKGYAIVAQCQGGGSADAAVTAAAAGTLGSHAAFATALDSLPSGQAIVAWVDGANIAPIANSFGSDGEDFSKSVADLARVNVLAGMSASGDGLELRVRLHSDSSSAQTMKADALSGLDKLPGGTVFGMAADFSAAKSLTDSLNQSIDGLPGAFGGSDSTDLRRFVKDLLGSRVSLSLVNPQSPEVRVLIDAIDGASAQDIAQVLGEQFNATNDDMTVTGNTVSLSSRGYQGGAGTLGADPLYRTAMADAPANTLLAGYVNVQDLVPAMDLSPADTANIRPVKAVGFSMGSDGNNAQLLVRVVIQ